MSETQFFPNAIYPIWFVPDKTPVGCRRRINLKFNIQKTGKLNVFRLNGIESYPAAGENFLENFPRISTPRGASIFQGGGGAVKYPVSTTKNYLIENIRRTRAPLLTKFAAH